MSAVVDSADQAVLSDKSLYVLLSVLSDDSQSNSAQLA